MKTKTLLALILLCAAGAMHAQATDKPQRLISTTGNATVYVVPDVTVVTFGIENFEKDLGHAIAQNREAAANLVKAIKALGIDDKNINTDILEVQVEYAYNNGRNEGANGYRVRRSYSVKLTDAKLLERLVETGLDHGANQLQGIDFQASDISKARNDARRQAMSAARDKAVLMAGELGAKVGQPLNISEAGEGYAVPMRGGRGMMAMAKMADASGGPGETLPLGQMSVQANVNVVFELE